MKGQAINSKTPANTTDKVKNKAATSIAIRTVAPINLDTRLSIIAWKKLRKVDCVYICFQGEKSVFISMGTEKISLIVCKRLLISPSSQPQPEPYHHPNKEIKSIIIIVPTPVAL